MIARLLSAFARLAALVRPGRLDRDARADLQAHFDLLVDDLVAHGMDPAAARREARLRFGSMASALEAHTDARSVRWIETFARDARYGTRLLRKQPMLTAAVVIILAIGIAIPASVLSLMNGFLFRRPASRDPDAFVRVIRPQRGSAPAASVSEYLAFREQASSLREVSAWSSQRLSAPLGSDDPTEVRGQLVSCNFLRLFTVEAPLAGRLFAEDDCRSDAPVAVISDAIWRHRFGADPAIVGRTVPYGKARIVVVGVASAPSFVDQWDDPDLVAGLWVPYSAQAAFKDVMAFGHGGDFLSAENAHRSWLEIAGLLAPGATRGGAAAELHRIQASLPSPERQRQRPLVLSDGTRWAAIDSDDMWSIVVMALTLPIVIMFMACINAAALLLSRAVSRQQEMALRRALGTSKAGLLRMLLTEHLVVAALAGAVSLAVVYIVPPFVVWQFGMETSFGAATPDWRVLAGIAMAVLLAALLSGLTPSREALRPRATDSLLARLGSAARGRRPRSRRIFVGVQIAACMMPLVVAVAFARAANRYNNLEFARDDVIVANIRADAARKRPLSEMADRLDALPGVDEVAYLDWLPLVLEGAIRIQIPGQHVATPLHSRVSPQFFELFDIPILAGRLFEAAEHGTDPSPIVVSQQFARRFFPDINPLGQVLEEYTNPVLQTDSVRRLIIVGIAGDRPTGMSSSSRALTDGSIIYEPMSSTASGGQLVIRAGTPIDVVAEAVRPLLRELVGMPVPVTTFQARLDERVAVVRDVQKMLAVLGAVALALAVIGVAGTVAFNVNQRRKAFAVQMALGAGPWIVRRGVIRSGLRPVPISLAIGLLASWGAVRTAESLRLLPVGSFALDPLPYLAVTLLMIAVALATLLAVAYPVGHRDPLPVLREE